MLRARLTIRYRMLDIRYRMVSSSAHARARQAEAGQGHPPRCRRLDRGRLRRAGRGRDRRGAGRAAGQVARHHQRQLLLALRRPPRPDRRDARRLDGGPHRGDPPAGRNAASRPPCCATSPTSTRATPMCAGSRSSSRSARLPAPTSTPPKRCAASTASGCSMSASCSPALGWPRAEAQARAILFYSYLFGQSLLDGEAVPAAARDRAVHALIVATLDRSGGKTPQPRARATKNSAAFTPESRRMAPDGSRSHGAIVSEGADAAITREYRCANADPRAAVAVLSRTVRTHVPQSPGLGAGRRG